MTVYRKNDYAVKYTICHYAHFCFSKSTNSFNKGDCAQSGGIKRRQTPGLGTSSSAVHVSFQVLRLEVQALHREEHCHIVYINQPSGHVKVTGSAKFLVGGSCTRGKKNVWSCKDDAR